MTIKQPRIAGPQPSLRDLAPSDSDCTIAIQAMCHGPLDTKVTAVSGAAARPGREHIALRFGRVLLFLEDRTALEALGRGVHSAEAIADRVFGPAEDAFTEAERSYRRRFERTRDGTLPIA